MQEFYLQPILVLEYIFFAFNTAVVDNVTLNLFIICCLCISMQPLIKNEYILN